MFWGIVEPKKNTITKYEVNIEDMQISIGTKSEDSFVNLEEGALLKVKSGAEEAENAIEVKYADKLQGMFVLTLSNLDALNTLADTIIAEGEKRADIPVFVKFAKRGLSGVPTFMDWDGCVGSVKVLLQK